ncbi:CPBP family intramembrane metalloprotease [bacterium]|nr:CPBP family intramembrane metalloprotease [bacterium]MBP9806884.1 CPBP family intramembrane metalloprotease [bacterium]
MASDPLEVDNPRPNPGLNRPFWSDKVVWLLMVLALVGFGLYVKLDSRVFPSASIDLKYSREQIAKQSRDRAEICGYKTQSTIESTTFTFFNESKTFLEYELGLDEANRLMKDKVPVWSWTTRYCKQNDLEQFRVWLSPTGKLLAFMHSFEDERAMPTIKHEEALARAQTFLEKEVNRPMAGLKLVRDETTTKAHRDDHSFTWEDTSAESDFKGAKLRYYVAFAGNELSEYSSFLNIPDEWKRKYSKVRSMNELLQNIANIFYGTLQALAVLVVPWALTRKQMRWRFAVFGGLVTAVVGALDAVNDYSSVIDSYDPSSSYRDYMVSYYFRQAVATISSFVSGVLLFGGADVIYRLCYPKRIALENYLTLKGFASKEGRTAVLVGYCVFAVHMGWIIAYYVMGEKLNFWCPLGVDDYQLLGSAVPFFSAVSLGIHAATQEETIARVVALSLMEKLTGRFWIANLFQAASWGFMHSSYPQQPAYARGVELTIGGLFYGYIMRRYGLLPCFIGHYLVDAFLTVKPLFSAEAPWLRATGLLPLIPFVVATLVSLLYDYYKKKRASSSIETSLAETSTAVSSTADPDATLFNEALPVHSVEIKPLADEGEAYTYQPFRRKARWILAIIGVCGITFSFCTSTPLPGDRSRVTIDRERAIVRAKEILKRNGVEPDTYLNVASLATNVSAEEMQYIFEQRKLVATLELASLTQPGFIWSVRFFRFLDPTEYKVELYGDGREYSFDITEDDDAPGASITKPEAEKLALAYVKRVHPEYKDVVIDKSSWSKRKRRADYDVECKVPSLKVAEADYKITLQVVGDVPCNFSQAWQLPQKWRFERSKETSKDHVFKGMRDVAYYVMGGLTLWWGIGILRSGVVRWRPGIFIGIAAGLLVLPEEFNHWPVFLNQYNDSSLTQSAFILNQLLGLVKDSTGKMVATFVSITLGLAVYRLLSPRLGIMSVVKAAFRPSGVAPRLMQEQMWLDGILVAMAWAALNQTKDSLLDFALSWFSPEIRTASLSSLANLTDYIFPVASDLIELAPSLLGAATMALIGAGLYNKYVPRFSFFVVFITLATMLKYSYARHWQDFVMYVISDTLQQIIFFVFVARLARFNPVAYLVKVVIDDSLPLIYVIWIFGWPCFAPTFFSLIIYALLPLLLLAYYRARNKRLSITNPAIAASVASNTSNIGDEPKALE